MPKVFVVQEPVKRNPGTGVTERLMDLTPAARYGELETMLPSISLPLGAENWVPKLRSALSAFSDDDYLLPVGDMSAIAASAAIAAQHNNGRFKVLKWDRGARAYAVQQIDIYGSAA